MTPIAADLQLAVSGLLSAVAQVAVGALVIGVVLLMVYTVMRDSL